MDSLTVVSFLFFTTLVAAVTWRMTRGRSATTEEGYFLAGRSLGGIVIAGSLLLTNLSTEQLVGLNGGAFRDGLAVMAWGVIAALALVLLALVFLPRYLARGFTTTPEFLEERYGPGISALTTFVFVVAYMLILLPFVLFLGAKGLNGMLDLETMLGLGELQTIWVVVVFIGLVGSAYAVFGGLRAVAVSDTLNGLGLLVGGVTISWLALRAAMGDGTFADAFAQLRLERPEHLRSLAGDGHPLDWPTLFTGVLLLNVFYWTTNQQIIQRTLGAKSLAEGQKGVLLAAFFKVLAPLILVLPGLLAYQVFAQDPSIDVAAVQDGDVYGMLVRHVLPEWMTGFFAAVVMGSILSTFNSVLNSSATLFSIGVYKKIARGGAPTQQQLVRSGQICSALVAVFAVIAAPTIFHGRDGLFHMFQSLNGIYFVPILAVMLFGMVERSADGRSAVIAVLTGLVAMVLGTFFDGGEGGWLQSSFGSGFHYMGAVFVLLVVLQASLGRWMKRAEPYRQRDAGAVDLEPWKHARLCGALIVIAVLSIYVYFAG